MIMRNEWRTNSLRRLSAELVRRCAILFRSHSVEHEEIKVRFASRAESRRCVVCGLFIYFIIDCANGIGRIGVVLLPFSFAFFRISDNCVSRVEAMQHEGPIFAFLFRQTTDFG